MLTPDIPKSPALVALHDERAHLRAELATAAAALARAARNVEDWTEQQSAAEREAAAQETAHCALLAARIAADGPAPIPPVEPDSAAARQLAHTRLNLSIALKAQSTLRGAHATTADRLVALEGTIAAEADRLLCEQREALAQKVETSFAAFVADVEALRALAPDHLHTPANILRVPVSPRVAAALSLLPQLEDGIHTPVNILRGGLNSSARFNAARTALIDGAHAQ